jgi:hypothetical protein
MYEQLYKLYIALLKDDRKIDPRRTDKVHFIISTYRANKSFEARKVFFL